MFLGVVALLLAAVAVMKFSATQLQALAPGAPAASGALPAQANTLAPAQAAADRVSQSIEQGAAVRAAEAASQ